MGSCQREKKDQLETPVYLVNEEKIEENLQILHYVEEQTGCRILLAQKAFSMFRLYPLVGKYLSGTCASGLYEARLSAEEMGKEDHVYAPAYKKEEMEELLQICDHIVFNSLTELERHRSLFSGPVKKGKVKIGLRVNPEHSTQGKAAIYDPCRKGSRFGIRRSGMPEKLPEGVTGLHLHTLCEQGAEPLIETFLSFEAHFAPYLRQIEWLNLGGGHHITAEGYDLEGLMYLIQNIQDKYHLTVYLEPGEAIALNAGSLITTVMDVVETDDLPVLILDTSAECHMPDVLEMPYRPPLLGAGKVGEKPYCYRLSSRSCLAGDIVGEYSFDHEIEVGERLEFLDMAIYSMVKNNTFNGMPLPDIALEHRDGTCEVVRHFGYGDFKGRLS